MRKTKTILDGVKAVVACTLVFIAAVSIAWIKVDAYGGHPECLFVRCVKVVP